MTTTSPRPFIAAMQVTLDGYILGPDGEADWVDSWADGLELLPEVDAFVLGGRMFPDYEQFWAAILDNPAAASEWLGRDPYPRELNYARVAAKTPHLTLPRPRRWRCGPRRSDPVGEVDAARCPGLRSQKLKRLSLGDPSE